MGRQSERKNHSHKGMNGKVGIIGGSIDYSGAPALSAQAALRTGCDLTQTVTSQKVSDIVASYSENLIVREYSSNYLDLSGVEKCLETVKWSDVYLIGPGLSQASPQAITKIIEKSQKPAVVDADAIKPAIKSNISNAVLTPHREESKIIEEKHGSIEEFIQKKEDIVVLKKGSIDKIYSDKGVTEIEKGHPGMTVGGTGDIMAGIIASLIAQGMDKEEAAAKAAKVNGKAGEKAAEEYGDCLLATDLLELIPGFI